MVESAPGIGAYRPHPTRRRGLNGCDDALLDSIRSVQTGAGRREHGIPPVPAACRDVNPGRGRHNEYGAPR